MVETSRWLDFYELHHRAIRLADRITMIRRARKIGIRKRNPSMRTPAQDVPRRRLAVRAKKESRLRIHVRVAPAIENDSRDVSARIESAGREHVVQLLAEPPL